MRPESELSGGKEASIEDFLLDQLRFQVTEILSEYHGAPERSLTLIANFLQARASFFVASLEELEEDPDSLVMSLESPLGNFSMKIMFRQQMVRGDYPVFYPVIKAIDFGLIRYDFDGDKKMTLSLITDYDETVPIDITCLDAQDEWRTELENSVSFDFKSGRESCVLSNFEAYKADEIQDILMVRSSLTLEKVRSRSSTQALWFAEWVKDTFTRKR